MPNLYKKTVNACGTKKGKWHFLYNVCVVLTLKITPSWPQTADVFDVPSALLVANVLLDGETLLVDAVFGQECSSNRRKHSVDQGSQLDLFVFVNNLVCLI